MDHHKRRNIRDVYGERGHRAFPDWALVPEHPCKRKTNRLARRRLRHDDRRTFNLHRGA